VKTCTLAASYVTAMFNLRIHQLLEASESKVFAWQFHEEKREEKREKKGEKSIDRFE